MRTVIAVALAMFAGAMFAGAETLSAGLPIDGQGIYDEDGERIVDFSAMGPFPDYPWWTACVDIDGWWGAGDDLSGNACAMPSPATPGSIATIEPLPAPLSEVARLRPHEHINRWGR